MTNLKVNMRDVARITGYSLGTVSLALNNRPGVSADTRKRVLAAIDELGYIPSVLGKAINHKKCGVVGVVVPVAGDYPFPQLVTGINAAAEDNHQPIFVSYSQDNPTIEARAMKLLLQLHVDGLILAAAPGHANMTMVRRIIESGTPVVQVERYLPNVPGDFVGSDNQSAAHEYTRRLVEMGHRRIGMVYTDLIYSVNDERHLGYLGGLREAGLEPDPTWVLKIHPNPPEEVPAQIRRYFTSPHRPTAMLWCATFLPTLVQTLDQLNLVNRRDVEVVLFDADPSMDLGGQRFLNVMQDAQRIGRLGFDVLMEASRAEEKNMQHGRVQNRLPCLERNIGMNS